MIQFDEHIFRMGWFNHQLVFVWEKGNKKLPSLKLTYPFPAGTFESMMIFVYFPVWWDMFSRSLEGIHFHFLDCGKM